eukprot:EG_transcript_20843
MCQLCDFSYAVPRVPPMGGRRAAPAACPAPRKAGDAKDTVSVSDQSQQDGLSSEAWSDVTSRPRGTAARAGASPHCPAGGDHVPLWALSSFHAAPLLLSTFFGIVERDVGLDKELSSWRSASRP